MSEIRIENVADLERHFPKFAGEIRNTADEAGYKRGVQEERERMKLLDSLNAPGREAIIAKAKYEEPKDARDIAMELLTVDKNNAVLDAMKKDAGAVDPALPPQAPAPDSDEEQARIVDLIANNVNSIRGFN